MFQVEFQDKDKSVEDPSICWKTCNLIFPNTTLALVIKLTDIKWPFPYPAPVLYFLTHPCLKHHSLLACTIDLQLNLLDSTI